MNDDIRRLQAKDHMLELRVLALEIFTDGLKLNQDARKATVPHLNKVGVVPLDAIAHAAQVAAELSERLDTYIKEKVGCAACRPARRPENTQSASDSPLT